MKKNFYYTILLMCALLVLGGCRTDQKLFAGALYTGVFAILFAIGGIIFVIKKIL